MALAAAVKSLRLWAKPSGPVTVPETRLGEPLTFGVPLPKGAVRDPEQWTLVGSDGASRRVQSRVLERWIDGSARWVLVDGRVDASATSETAFTLAIGDRTATAGNAPALSVVESPSGLVVDTGAVRFTLRSGGVFPFDRVEAAGSPLLVAEASGLTVTDARGTTRQVEIRTVDVEEGGALRSVVRMLGRVPVEGGRRAFDLTARVHFFAGLPTVRLLVTITNPNAARHKGGFWDLGDPGSILVKDVSLTIGLAGGARDGVRASLEHGAPWTEFAAPFEVYQDSSGGENWRSSNHINRERRVPNAFRGYRVRAGGLESTGLRATPIVSAGESSKRVTVTLPHFWQNFPKAIECDGRALIVRLFPGQYGDLHEIQGGEQKTHEVWLSFGADDITAEPLEWCRAPVVPCLNPEWVYASEAVPFLAPLAPDHAALVNAAVEGPDRFELKREVIDEYGWRHFGEIYGDHEAVRHTGSSPLVSHYNNQYDAVAGFAYQFLRTADPRWWTMMTELAAHVIDIDIYHTQRDKSAYNGGMFWHTYHYGDADTATHRTYPRAGLGRIHGGGPSADHNYTTGLGLCYRLTGVEACREAVLGLGQYVIDLDDGTRTVFKWLDRGDTGRAALSAGGYHGPGRGPANSLTALSEAARLGDDRRFARKADELVRRVIHPRDRIEDRRLDIPEQRWFYTMFLQALGRFLEDKHDRGEHDALYAYGRASLLHYADWMLSHEHPYLEKPEKLEFPTETWAAQDIRKSDVFALAALHADGEERARFVERAAFFQTYSTATLANMPTRVCTRPVVVLLGSGTVDGWRRLRCDGREPAVLGPLEFGPPAAFEPQRARAMRRFAWLSLASAAAVVLLAAVWLLRR